MNDSFIESKVLGTFTPEKRKFHGTERKFHRNESSLYGLFAPGNESAEERKVRHSFTPALLVLIVVLVAALYKYSLLFTTKFSLQQTYFTVQLAVL